MQQCIECVTSGLENLDMIKVKIESIRDEVLHLYPKKFFNKKFKEIEAHNLAVNQALNIVYSIEARYITGSSDAAPRVYRGIGLLYFDDETLFK